jgi:hypothetical protein
MGPLSPRKKISKEWEILQFKYATRHSLLKESRNWITWLIKHMAHQSFAIWDSCNKSRHGHDHSTSIQAETAQVHRDISVLYELHDLVLPEDRDLFCNSIDAHLLRPLSVLKGWLAINRKFILWSVKTAKLQDKQELAQFLNTLLPGLAALTYHAERKRPQTPLHVRLSSLGLLVSFTHSTKLPFSQTVTVLRHTPTPNNHLDTASGAFPTFSQTTPVELPHSCDLDMACANSTISKF